MAKRKTAKAKLSWKVWAGIVVVLALIGIGGARNSEPPAETSRAVVVTAEPTVTPEPTPSPVPTPTPYRIHGRDPETTVYVSRSGVIHSRHDCSGMKNYTEMTIEKADGAGYKYCEHCW